MITATDLGEINEHSNGTQRLYKLSEPIPFKEANKTEYVVVSALEIAFDTGMPETFIFPANQEGTIIDWGELPGSSRGHTNHAKAIIDAGWKLDT